MRRVDQKDDIAVYLKDQEYVANRYVMKCFRVTMLVFLTTFLLNLIGIFVIERNLMWSAFIPSAILYGCVLATTHFISLSDKWIKYFILFSIVAVITIGGVFITYHVVLVSLLPFLYATLYSSKKVMRYVYVLTVISTIIVVYCGYHFGLCDANMVLLTAKKAQDYTVNNQFVLTQINENPNVTLFLFFVIPRCIIYIAFMSVCNSLFTIVSGSLEKARISDEAERANRMKSQFLAKMSHEIRTPINAIMGINEMILRESKENHIKEYAHDVKDSSVVLLNIVNEILDSSKVESGKMELLCNDYEIGTLFNDLYNMMNVKAKEKGLELFFDIDSTMPKAYYGDDKRIRQILMNLMSNAVKYTKQGSVTLKVRCKSENGRARLHYSIKDTGIGIKKEDLGKIYDEFARFDVSKHSGEEGTGLGMKIARQFLELMGSTLQIESEYEKGSVFSFELEQKIVNSEPLGNFREKLLHSEKEENEKISFTAPNARVLVVDDHQLNLKVYSNLLKETKMKICEAESGQACLEMLRLASFDLVFIDHMMPEMDGIETFHAIKEERLCEGVPIIMLTANAILGDREKYIREGFDDFLSKPIIPEHLMEIVLKYVPQDLVTIHEEKEEAVLKSHTFKLDVLNELQKNLPEIDFETGLATSSQDEEFFLELLDDYANLTIKEDLEKYLQDNDYETYCIRIHGFKSSSYSIGANPLGDAAFEMECGTKDGFPTEIVSMQEKLFAQYDRICACYKEIKEKNR